MRKYRIIFMGTSDFSAAVLSSLLLLKQIKVVAIVTQPDKRIGRKQLILFSPIKKMALRNNLFILQPNKIDFIFNEIKNLYPDVILTCAYGQFIPERIINLATINSFNIHASLLPCLRGGAPIHKAIIYGKKETGISLAKIVNKMDAGEIYFQSKVKIDLNDNVETLSNKLIFLAKNMIKNHLINIIKGKYSSIKQNENLITFAFNIKREDEKIDWNESLLNIYNKIRGLYPYPISYTTLNNKFYKIYIARMLDDKLSYEDQNLLNGTIVDLLREGIKVKVVDGYLLIIKLQKEGKVAISASFYYKNFTNDICPYNQFK